MAREIPANGYGIADLVVVTWTADQAAVRVPTEEFIRKARPCLRAFEVKVRDWRQGLLQANRYRQFVEVPILVVSANHVFPAIRFISTFRLLKVGLWSFDPKTRVIVRHYTPRPSRASDQLQRRKVIERLAKATKALPVL